MRYDVLPDTSLRMVQPEGMYHFNSDTSALGMFLKAKHSDSLLDIGCGTGALLLYASLQRPKRMCGIDLFPEVLEAAAANLALNGVEAELVRGDVNAYRPAGQFDVIVCNPPYFRTKGDQLKNENAYLRAARHEDSLTPDSLFACVRRLMKTNGTFYIVHRASRCAELILLAAKYGLYARRLKPVYESEDDAARAVLLSFGFSEREIVVEEPLVRTKKAALGGL